MRSVQVLLLPSLAAIVSASNNLYSSAGFGSLIDKLESAKHGPDPDEAQRKSSSGDISSTSSSSTPTFSPFLSSHFNGTDGFGGSFVPSLADPFRDSMGFYNYKETGMAQSYQGGHDGADGGQWEWQEEEEKWAWHKKPPAPSGDLEDLLELLPKASDFKKTLLENLDIFAVGLASSFLHQDAFLLFMVTLTAVVMGGLFGPIISSVVSMIL